MATHLIEETILIPVQAAETYYLTVLIGNGEMGSTYYQDFEGNTVTPEVADAFIGQGDNIVNQSRTAASIILEVNPDTNNMVVSYYVTAGKVSGNLPEKATGISRFTALEGDTITFITTLSFVANL